MGMNNLSPPIIGFTVNKPANTLNTGVPVGTLDLTTPDGLAVFLAIFYAGAY